MMFRHSFPVLNARSIRPIGDGNAETIAAARGLAPEIAWLFFGERHHSSNHPVVSIITGFALA